MTDLTLTNTGNEGVLRSYNGRRGHEMGETERDDS